VNEWQVNWFTQVGDSLQVLDHLHVGLPTHVTEAHVVLPAHVTVPQVLLPKQVAVPWNVGLHTNDGGQVAAPGQVTV
jgi:hypothetical protein